jgi:hypothetical protein
MVREIMLMGALLSSFVQPMSGNTKEVPLAPETVIEYSLEAQEGVDTVQLPFDKTDVDMLARLIYTEARGIDSDMEKAAVVWCVLNRVDSDRWPNTIEQVVTQKNQFAYDESAPLMPEFETMAENVLWRWWYEKMGVVDVGRVLPKCFMYFSGDGERNCFRAEINGKKYYWDWACDNPYES